MVDRYSKLVRSDIGTRVADLLGLPKPVELRRYEPGDPLVEGIALVGGADGGVLRDHATTLLVDHGVEVHEQADEADTRYAAVVFDASGITSAADLDVLYRFVQSGVRRLERNARIVILGTVPTALRDGRARTAQRTLEGFVRSVAKEIGGTGATANLLEVTPGAEQGVKAPLRFLLSGRSAFVTGQRVTVGAATDTAPMIPADLDRPLVGKVAVVTGAARGIGAAIARVLARDGAHVICLDLPSAGEQLAGVANEVGGESLGLDVTADDAAQRLIDHVDARHDGLDIVVHNAGITRDKTLAGMDDARWNLVLSINLLALERIDDALLDAGTLNEGARIVCVSSMSGIAGNRGQTNYAASKAGVIGHVEVLAPRLATIGGTANAVAPGFIETEMTDAMPFGPREVGRRISSLGQGGLPVDVAETIAYLAQPDATWVNGTTLRVCGQNLLGA
jgi:3-oxoacyl-[acyl-carrier protein] reductase